MESVTIAQFEQAQRMLKAAPTPQKEQLAREGVRRFPLYGGAHLALAEVLEEAGNRDEALAVLSKGAELHKPPAALHIRLGRLLIEEGRRTEASTYLQAARLRAPDDAELVRLLALLQDRD